MISVTFYRNFILEVSGQEVQSDEVQELQALNSLEINL